MKPGFVQFIYMPGPEVKGPYDVVKWQINELAAMGGKVLNGGFPPGTEAQEEEIRQLLIEKGIEFEMGIFGWQDLIGPKAKESREMVLASVARSKKFNNKILRTAYNGRLQHEFSRFNKLRPVKEQMKLVIDNLKELAKIFEDEDVYLAIENHCDFNAREFVEIFTAVNSKHIGAGWDTANGYTVFQDPNDEAELMAPFTFSTHIKDMAVMPYKLEGVDLIPYIARGTAVGDGNVDIPHIIDVLDKKSPFANGLRLIIEQGWMYIPEGEDPRLYNQKCLKKGMTYLKSLLKD
jgi:sugar phosphate isomerase/epimerase